MQKAKGKKTIIVDESTIIVNNIQDNLKFDYRNDLISYNNLELDTNELLNYDNYLTLSSKDDYNSSYTLRLMYVFKKLYSFLKTSNIYIQGGTSNSNDYKCQLRLENGDDKPIFYRGALMSTALYPIKCYAAYMSGNISISNDEVIDTLVSLEGDASSLINEINEYLNAIYTIGNYLPVPMLFDSERSGFTSNKASIDLTLSQIYNWYKRNETNEEDPNPDKELYDLFKEGHSNKTTSTIRMTVKNTKQWLSNFNTWNDFIESNYLQDFVILISESNYGEPIMFFNNRTFTEYEFYNPTILDNSIIESNFKQYFTIAKALIIKRNERLSSINNI
ncbi:MAG: hypothetical protein RR646_03330 [Erysipelotrichaceae bacterium]